MTLFFCRKLAFFLAFFLVSNTRELAAKSKLIGAEIHTTHFAIITRIIVKKQPKKLLHYE